LGYDGTSTNYSGIPQGILPPVQGNEDQQAYYNAMNNGDYGAPQLNDPNCNTLYPAIYNKGQWYAQINGKYVVITDCCPTEMPTVTNDCCDATQKNIQALAGQITKLQELVLRNSAGEKTQAVDLTSVMNELSAIHALVDSMRNQKPNEIKQLDITPLQKQINDLQTAVSNIKVTVPQGNGQVVQQYNDSGSGGEDGPKLLCDGTRSTSGGGAAAGGPRRISFIRSGVIFKNSPTISW
jgi:hypothetical protein